jgi:CRP-like cAMP-binding protein
MAASWLEGLAEPVAAGLRGLGTERRYGAGVVIFHHGDEPGSVLVLLEGRVKLAILGPQGREVILGFAGPGDLLGDVAALDGGPRSATAETVDAVRALVVPRAAFEAFLAGRPDAALALMRSLAARLRRADEQRLEFAAYDVVGRLARRLIDLCERHGEVGEHGTVDLAARGQREARDVEPPPRPVRRRQDLPGGLLHPGEGARIPVREDRSHDRAQTWMRHADDEHLLAGGAAQRVLEVGDEDGHPGGDHGVSPPPGDRQQVAAQTPAVAHRGEAVVAPDERTVPAVVALREVRGPHPDAPVADRDRDPGEGTQVRLVRTPGDERQLGSPVVVAHPSTGRGGPASDLGAQPVPGDDDGAIAQVCSRCQGRDQHRRGEVGVRGLLRGPDQGSADVPGVDGGEEVHRGRQRPGQPDP